MANNNDDTVAELRERGWVIPDGVTVGDIGHTLRGVHIRVDACCQTLDGMNLEDLHAGKLTRSDRNTVVDVAERDDRARAQAALEAIGVTAPAGVWGGSC